MTRKDYVLIAAALKRAQVAEVYEHDKNMRAGVEYAARCVAITLAEDNPRFDRDRFLQACGVAS